MFYGAVRPLLFSLDPETAHAISLRSLHLLECTGLARLAWGTAPSRPIRVMGLDFPNPLGLAPGLDKHAEYIDALASLGFGFLEIGAVTPRPQPGNPRPRLFRLPEAEAIINRYGFNSVGIDQFVSNLRRAHYKGVLGVNLGKNKDTPLHRAVEDYAICLEKIYPFAHFATINVSSPNTPDLRKLQSADELGPLLAGLHQLGERLAQAHGRRVALALKIAPDMDWHSIEAIARIAVEQKMDAVIATNTTVSREGVQGLRHADEQGGLSGAPLRDTSTAVIRHLAQTLDGALPIIGVGGIMCASDAREKLEAGASLVQLYCGLVYRGPQLVRDIVAGLQ
jgi:dihydroorotate dehydrogenase